MNQLVNNIKHIQVKQISYAPRLFQAIITYQPYHHPYEFDESDDLEYQKKVVNKLVEDKWFTKAYDLSNDRI